MYNKIYKKKDKIIIEIPLRSERHNPYSEETAPIVEMDNIAGWIGKDLYGNKEMGFVQLIDMSYKGKDDQWTALFYHYHGYEEEFEKLCKEIGIGMIHEHD